MPEADNSYRLDKRQARAAFDRAAVSYDAAAALQQEIGERLLERLDFIRMQPQRVLEPPPLAWFPHSTARLNCGGPFSGPPSPLASTQ